MTFRKIWILLSLLSFPCHNATARHWSAPLSQEHPVTLSNIDVEIQLIEIINTTCAQHFHCYIEEDVIVRLRVVDLTNQDVVETIVVSEKNPTFRFRDVDFMIQLRPHGDAHPKDHPIEEQHGFHVGLNWFFCNDESSWICTELYAPSTCQLAGQLVEGSNICDAKRNLADLICGYDLDRPNFFDAVCQRERFDYRQPY